MRPHSKFKNLIKPLELRIKASGAFILRCVKYLPNNNFGGILMT